MSRYIGPRVRVLRALGVNLPGLSAKTMEKRPAPPGQHGAKRKRQASNYGKRLREKQKLRAHYGLTETQLRRAAAAARSHGSAMRALVQQLELRLDNVVFRAGFARTIPAARQLVGHGHVQVNGARLTYPSARLRAGDVISLSRERSAVAVRLQQAQGAALATPEWLEVNGDALTARLSGLPQDDGVPFPIELPLVIEFYS